MVPNFNNPVGWLVGAICVWLAITTPFAFICRNYARADAMSSLEAFLLGLAGGPLGLLVVRKANEKAAIAARDTAKLIDARRRTPEPDAPPPPPHLMPGGNAFQPPPERGEWLEGEGRRQASGDRRQ